MSITARTRLGRRIAAAAVAVAMSAALAACASSGSSTAGTGSSALDAALKKGGTITYWTWTSSAKAQVAAFEKAYPKVKVNLVNTGAAADEYTKLENADKAGSGAPDVVQIEYFALPQFALSDALVDLSSYGLDSLKSEYTASTWSNVNVGGKLVGLPQDSGPMVLFYNKTEFEKYGLTVPTTWDEYVADAQKLHAADPTKYITSDTGDAGQTTSLIWQAGGRPFTTKGTKVTVDFDDAGTKRFTSMYQQLIDGGLLANISGWTDDWYKGLNDGTIASLVTGAWMPATLEGSVTDTSGQWAVAPIPSYDGKAVTAENGGSSEAVTKQSKNPALAAAFLRWLNSSKTSVKVFLDKGNFPSTTSDLSSSSFLSAAPAYFGGQKINKVLSAAAGQVASGWQYLPYQVYANSIFNDAVGGAYTGGETLQQGLEAWGKRLVSYGNSQGFTVTG